MSASLPSIERSVWLPADRSTVWRHLTDGALLSIWFGGEARIRVRPGGEVRVEVEGQPVRWGTVEEVVPERRIQWSWRVGEGDPSLVEMDIHDDDAGVRLVVTETLLPYEIIDLSPSPGRSEPSERRLLLP